MEGGADAPNAANTANGGHFDINNNNSILSLTFSSTTTINSLAIYDGYDNRDDGTYTIGTSASGTALATYTIVSTNTNSSITNTDDILLSFATPLVLTAGQSITIGFTNGTDTQNTDSFDDIQVFTSTATPEPSTYAMLALGLGGLVAFQRLRRARA